MSTDIVQAKVLQLRPLERCLMPPTKIKETLSEIEPGLFRRKYFTISFSPEFPSK